MPRRPGWYRSAWKAMVAVVSRRREGVSSEPAQPCGRVPFAVHPGRLPSGKKRWKKRIPEAPAKVLGGTAGPPPAAPRSSSCRRPAAAALLAFAAVAGGGLAAEAAGVCDRTRQVQNAIVDAAGAANCAAVTKADLEEVTDLDLSGQSIAALQAGDFDGLVRLRALDLSHNGMTGLPDGVFDPLLLLETLRLDNNRLAAAPKGAFDELLLLETLTLHGNGFDTFPEGMFDALSPFGGLHPTRDEPPRRGLELLRGFLDDGGIGSVEEFISALPALHKERFALVSRSGGLGSEFVSAVYPRVVSFGGDGRFLFSWTTHPGAPAQFRDAVEFLLSTGEEWLAGVVDFSGTSPAIRQPATCAACHGSQNKPLWGEFNRGFGGVEPDFDASESEDPRITALNFARRPGSKDRIVLGLARAVAWRHAEVLAHRLRSGSGYEDILGTLMCDQDTAVVDDTPFSLADYHPALRADKVGVQGGVGTKAYFYGASYNALDSTLRLILTQDLWNRDRRVRDLYRDLPMRELVLNFENSFLLRPEASREGARGELIQWIRLHLGHGSRALLDVHAPRRYSKFPSAWSGHMERMGPRVCHLLRQHERAPANLRAEALAGHVRVRWDAPSAPEWVRRGGARYEPASYRVLRRRLPDRNGNDGEAEYRQIGEPGRSARSFADTDLDAARRYAYRVQGVYDYGESPLTDPVSVFSLAGTASSRLEFILVDAVADRDVRRLRDGAVVDLGEEWSHWTIRVGDRYIAPSSSVRLELSGPLTETHTDSAAPYSLFGDDGGDYAGAEFPNGDYRLTATVHLAADDGGGTLATRSIGFTVTGSGSASPVTGFTVLANCMPRPIIFPYCTDFYQDFRLMKSVPLYPNTRVNFWTAIAHRSFKASLQGSGDIMSGFDIRAEIPSDKARLIGSVTLELRGTTARKRTVGAAPYLLHGGDGRELPNGSYLLTATPHRPADQSGGALPSRSVVFSVVGSFQLGESPVTGFTLVDQQVRLESGRGSGDITEITEGAVLDVSGTSGRFNFRADFRNAPVTAIGGIGIFPSSLHVQPSELRVVMKLTGPANATSSNNNRADGEFLIHGPQDAEGFTALPAGDYRLAAWVHKTGNSLIPNPESLARHGTIPGRSVDFTVIHGDTEAGAESSNATLASLALSGADIGAFAAGTTSYTAQVEHGVTETTVTAAANDAGASVAILPSDADTAAGHQVTLTAGANAITVTVTAADGTQQTYRVTVTVAGPPSSDATLASLALSGVDIGAFAAGTTSYTAQVEHGVTQTTVTAAANDAGASLAILPNDADAAAGHQVTLTAGANAITITVTAADGTQQAYRVTVTVADGNVLTARFLDVPLEHDGSAFAFELRFSEEFESLSYRTLRDSAFTVTGGRVTGARRLTPGRNQRWEIRVAPDGNGAVTVSLPAGRACDAAGAVCTEDGRRLSNAPSAAVAGPRSSDATLASLALSGVDFGTFAAGTTSYTAEVGRGVTRTTVTAAANDAGASVAILPTDAAAAAGHQVTLTAGANVITVTVTAADRTQQTYRVTVTVASPPSSDATLASLALSGVDIGTFAAGTTSYTAQVEHGVTRTTVTAAANDAGASLAILPNDADAAAGHQVTLTAGANAITVTVTAADGTQQAYRVTVTVASPPSSDATLASLALSGVDFGTFAAGTTSYTANVEHGVTRTTVTAAANDAGASVAILPNDADAAAGHQVTLTAGANAITITVTAADGTQQAYRVTVTVAAGNGLTARFLDVPAEHDGSAFTFELRFSEEFGGLSYRTLRDSAFTVTGGRVTGARRLTPGSNQRWEITVAPDGNGAVTVSLPAGRACDAAGAVCTEDGRRLSNAPSAAVAGARSSDATLASLALSGVDFGTFASGTTSYTANVEHGVTRTTVTAAANDAGASVAILPNDADAAAGHQVTLTAAANTITVTVTAADGTQQVYRVTVTVASPPSSDATLASLALSGVDIGTFSSGATSYTANVEHGVTRTTVTAAANDTGASVAILPTDADAAAGHQVTLAAGANPITITVTAADGTQRTYRVTVTVASPPSSDATLASLALSGVDFGTFSSGTTSYTANVGHGVTRTTVAAAANDAGASVAILPTDADAAAGHQVTLAAGANPITITVTAADGTQRTYRVTVTVASPPSNDATLASLALSGVDIGTFSSGATSYTAEVEHGVTRTTVAAAANDAGASVAILPTDADAAAGHQVTLAAGANPITITVTAADGTQRTYRVTVTVASPPSNDATLASLALSGVDIGTFSSGTTSYTADVGHGVTRTTVTAAANDAGASVAILPNDADTADGHQVTLAAGANTISVTVTAADGTQRTYRVTVTVASPPSSDVTLASLTLSGMDIGAFSSSTTSYTADVGHGVTRTTVTAAANDAGASVAILPNDADAAAGHQVTLTAGANAITITVTAADGTQRTYRVTVTVASPPSSDATLASLALSGVDIGAFSSGATSYTANVGHGVTRTTVTAAANDAGASVAILPNDADAAAGHQVALAAGANPITITVTAADGAQRTYRVTVTVAAADAAPVVTTGGPFAVLEGATAVATLAAADADTAAEKLGWAIPSGAAGGADGGHFALSTGGALSFRTAPDYEAPGDANGDGVYEVTVRVTDGAGAATADLRVTVGDRNEAPVADAGPDRPEVAAGATVTLSGSGSDPDAGDGADTLRFRWTQTGGPTVALSDRAAAVPTFAAPAGLTDAATLGFTLRVTDDEGLFGEDAVSVTVAAAAAEEETADATLWSARLTVGELGGEVLGYDAGRGTGALAPSGWTRDGTSYTVSVLAFNKSSEDVFLVISDDPPGFGGLRLVLDGAALNFGDAERMDRGLFVWRDAWKLSVDLAWQPGDTVAVRLDGAASR